MDYFQGVVTEYLVANRSMFVNTELLIQLEVGDAPAKGRNWYCDAVAVDLRESKVFLCEVTYSKTLYALVKRLTAWAEHWPEIRAALERDSKVPLDWEVRPWIFIPQTYHDSLSSKIEHLCVEEEGSMPKPLITYLESVVPWNYKTWDRKVTDLEDSEG